MLVCTLSVTPSLFHVYCLGDHHSVDIIYVQPVGWNSQCYGLWSQIVWDPILTPPLINVWPCQVLHLHVIFFHLCDTITCLLDLS